MLLSFNSVKKCTTVHIIEDILPSSILFSLSFVGVFFFFFFFRIMNKMIQFWLEFLIIKKIEFSTI